MKWTFFIRTPSYYERRTSFPGPPRPDEIIFTCEEEIIDEAYRVFRAFARVTDLNTTGVVCFGGDYNLYKRQNLDERNQ